MRLVKRFLHRHLKLYRYESIRKYMSETMADNDSDLFGDCTDYVNINLYLQIENSIRYPIESSTKRLKTFDTW